MDEAYQMYGLETPRRGSLRRVRRTVRRHPYLAALAGASVFGLFGLGTYLLIRRYARPTYTFTGPGGYLIIDGRRFNISAPTNHTLQFTGLSERTERPRLGILHVSEGEPVDGSGVYDTLVGRGLSVDYILDRDGTIWVLNDPGRYQTRHAGSTLSPVSWGVEIVGFGELEPGQSIPSRGQGRELYQASVHGQERTFGDLTPAQYAALEQLTSTVNDALGISRQVLVSPNTSVPSSFLQQFSGVIGHYNASLNKTDPGPRTLERVARQPGWSGVAA